MMTDSMSHAMLMDRIYRHQRHIYDLSRKWYLLGRDRVIDNLVHLPDGSDVLEAGCGTARNLRVASRRYPELNFYGIDASANMLRTAQRLVDKTSTGGRITLGQADIMNFSPQTSFGVNGFDRIMVSYTLSMIPEWQLALAKLLTCLAPEGVIDIVDFGTQRHHPAYAKKALRAWLGLFHVQPSDQLAADFEQVCRDNAMAEVTARDLYGGYAVLLSARRPANQKNNV